MAVITRKEAQALIKAGKATELTVTETNAQGDRYVAINRHDIARTDHYLAKPADCARVEARNA